MRNKEQRYQMYMQYMREINNMLHKPFDGGVCMRAFEKLDEGFSNVQWVPVKVKTQEVGFIIIFPQPNCHPDTDWYIEDAFVLPEYRNQGLMQKTVSKFIKENGGKYCLFIIDENQPARHMWPAVFEKMKYQPLSLRDVLPKREGITQYGWEPVET